MAKGMTAVPVTPGTTIQIQTRDIPDFVAVDLAQSAFEAIRKAYADPAVQAAYREWKAARAAREVMA